MNEAMNNLLTRRSCRKYKPDMLPQEVLDEILRAGTYAASGHGTQNPIMIAVTDKEMRDKLSKLNAKIFGKPDIDPFYGAPVVVIVLADKKYPTYVYDGSLRWQPCHGQFNACRPRARRCQLLDSPRQRRI